MHKKLITACLALVAFAAMAVVPALASASPVLTDSGGATVATGTEITATNEGNVKFVSNLGTVECSSATLKGKVATNSGTKIEGNIESASFTGTGTGACTSTWGINWTVTTKPPYCLVSTGNDTATINNGTCGKTSGGPRFILETGSTVCEYERQTSGVGTGIATTYATNTSPLKLTTEAEQKFKLVSGSTLSGCPSEGTLTAVFIVKTSAGGELKVS